MSNHPNRSKASLDPARTRTPEEIRAAREAAGLTQTDATALIFSSVRAWQQWERGDRRMHPAFFDLFTRKVKEL